MSRIDIGAKVSIVTILCTKPSSSVDNVVLMGDLMCFMFNIPPRSSVWPSRLSVMLIISI